MLPTLLQQSKSLKKCLKLFPYISGSRKWIAPYILEALAANDDGDEANNEHISDMRVKRGGIYATWPRPFRQGGNAPIIVNWYKDLIRHLNEAFVYGN